MLKILLIEDELIIAEDIRLSLKKEEYAHVFIAKNHEEAFQYFGTNVFDLIISDVQLNDQKDGIEIVEELNSIQQIPIVFLTAYSDQETIARIEATKPSAYLLKPYNINQLKTTINLSIRNFNKRISNQQLNLNQLKQIESLTIREKEILKTLSSGKMSKEIADALHISVNTVEQHKKNIKKKLELKTVGELIHFAVSSNLNGI